MTETLETFSEREEIEMLLPWYATGKLDAKDRDRVEHYLADHGDMRVQLEIIRDEQLETISANELLGAPVAGALDRLRTAVAAETPEPSKLAAVGRSLWQEIATVFSNPTPRAVQWAGAAAALLLIAQAGVIGSYVVPGSDSSGSYTTASGPQAGVNSGTIVIVRFAADAKLSDVAEVLASIKGELVAGPKPGGLYDVRIARKKVSAKDRDTIITKLKASPHVTLVLPKG
ncbi:MAG: hypothetical protein ACR2OV_09780 [Hyphomicrobiaceae bacterium]